MMNELEIYFNNEFLFLENNYEDYFAHDWLLNSSDKNND